MPVDPPERPRRAATTVSRDDASYTIAGLSSADVLAMRSAATLGGTAGSLDTKAWRRSSDVALDAPPMALQTTMNPERSGR